MSTHAALFTRRSGSGSTQTATPAQSDTSSATYRVCGETDNREVVLTRFTFFPSSKLVGTRRAGGAVYPRYEQTREFVAALDERGEDVPGRWVKLADREGRRASVSLRYSVENPGQFSGLTNHWPVTRVDVDEPDLRGVAEFRDIAGVDPRGPLRSSRSSFGSMLPGKTVHLLAYISIVGI